MAASLKARLEKLEEINAKPERAKKFVFIVAKDSDLTPSEQLEEARKSHPDNWANFVILTTATRD